MNRTRVSVLAAGLAAAAMLSACGVDREAEINGVIKVLEEKGLPADRACVEGVASNYSDDELESKAAEIAEAVIAECVVSGESEEAPEEGG
jgi:hypothetical protein